MRLCVHELVENVLQATLGLVFKASSLGEWLHPII